MMVAFIGSLAIFLKSLTMTLLKLIEELNLKIILQNIKIIKQMLNLKFVGVFIDLSLSKEVWVRPFCRYLRL